METCSGAEGAKDRIRFVISLAEVPEFGVGTGSAGGTAGM